MNLLNLFDGNKCASILPLANSNIIMVLFCWYFSKNVTSLLDSWRKGHFNFPNRIRQMLKFDTNYHRSLFPNCPSFHEYSPYDGHLRYAGEWYLKTNQLFLVSSILNSLSYKYFLEDSMFRGTKKVKHESWRNFFVLTQWREKMVQMAMVIPPDKSLRWPTTVTLYN